MSSCWTTGRRLPFPFSPNCFGSPFGMIPVFTLPRDRSAIAERLAYNPTEDSATRKAVERIVADIRRGGDRALLKATHQFDGVRLAVSDLRIPETQLEEAWKALPASLRAAMRLAAKRIRAFHKRQLRKSWTMTDAQGFRLSQRWTPLQNVGLYVPGGAAAYPSSVLMNAIPAQVAGVERIVAVTPPAREGVFGSATLGALYLAGVTEVYQVGGAQAVAALAYGTETIPRVDKVVGPGNRYVAEAKRLLYGTISIDMVAGPSEVMILADASAPLEWIAADMLAQAEHDPAAQAVAVLIGRKDGKTLAREVARQVAAAPRRAILEKSLPACGAIIQVKSLDAAIELANEKAPEHLELLVENARAAAKQIRHAGSIFIGRYSVEAIGDYIAGPNHVLPTGGTARFFSPLSVQDFLKLTQLIECGPKGIKAVGEQAAGFADAEGLDAHARSIRYRLESFDRKRSRS
ncbi:MAG: histidinol dehydrogenase [Candidatus Sumerlaeota bacterium]|nr:histidinol dehydrogenase [Candidatus Sumerlaeota bacterium]